MGERPGWSMEGRFAVVTGGGQGVGKATARLLAERGVAGVAICGRDRGKLERVAAEVEAGGTPCLAVPADLADVAQCFRLIDQAAERFGTLHCLVNAAGVTDRGTVDDTSPELFDLQFAVNARAPFFLIQRALPHLRRAGGGTVVNVVSIVSHGGPPFIAAYCGAKGALAVLTKNIANAVKGDRIRVNGLNMGWTTTPAEHAVQIGHHGRGEGWAEEVGAEQPFGRLLSPLDVARAIAFLASDESGLMTGAVVDFEQRVPGTEG
jgi:NAD(P)-dependent dehydrogenase (short-subunit alcohol dehydrogenase family)